MRLFKLCAILLTLILAGCAKKEITLSFELPADFHNPVRLLYYASDKTGGVFRETAVDITDGKGSINLPARQPAIIYLFASSQDIPVLAIYAEPGENISISAISSDMKTWTVEGNGVNKALSAWRKTHSGNISPFGSEALDKEVEKYVKAHPSAGESAVMLLFYYQRRKKPEDFDKLYRLITENTDKNDKIITAFAAADLIQPLHDIKFPQNLVLTGEKGWADTVKFSDYSAVFLIFKEKPSDSEKPTAADIKELIKNAEKSAVVEVFASTDSMTWRHHLRRDTIPELKRLWMPLATADSAAMALGVKRFPYYFVIDQNNKILYRGDNWNDVVKTKTP